MSSSPERKSSQRRYPAFYEKGVPIILAITAVIVVVLLLVAVAVILGRFPNP